MGVAVSDKFVQQARQALLESVYQRIELIALLKGEFVHALDPYVQLLSWRRRASFQG
jgi:peroxiredoxin